MMNEQSAPSPKPSPLPEEPTEPRSYRLIAGPCSAESREQLLATAEGLQPLRIDLFRAGIWKPRTKPGGFEGVGSEGLSWLAEVKEKFGYRTTTEVCTCKHAEAALEAGVDVLWIGARTSTNPHSVQEIAEVLRGSNTPLMIKNPMCPDLQLWIGTIERFWQVGITDISAIFRGFPPPPAIKVDYRNAPYWGVAFEFQNELPDIPLICDPSHIAGRREAIQAVSQKALDLGFQGLMVESHINPATARTDAHQQVTPFDLKTIIDNLVIRSKTNRIDDIRLVSYRATLAEMDNLLISNLAQRMVIATRIGELKKRADIPVLQEAQFEANLAECTSWAESLGLDPSFIKKIMTLIHEESVRIQHNNRK